MTRCDVPVMTVWCPLSVLGPVRHCSVWLHVLGLSLPHVPKIIWALGLCPQMHIKTNSCCSLELTGVKLTNSCSRSRVHWNGRENFQQPTLSRLSLWSTERWIGRKRATSPFRGCSWVRAGQAASADWFLSQRSPWSKGDPPEGMGSMDWGWSLLHPDEQRNCTLVTHCKKKM